MEENANVSSILKKNTSSRRYCSVVGCSNNQQKNPELRFYVFPGRSWQRERREKWIAAVRRQETNGKPWKPTKNSRICSAHFIGGEKSEDPRKQAYNPTIFPSVYKRKVLKDFGRTERLEARRKRILKFHQVFIDMNPICEGADELPHSVSIEIQTDLYDSSKEETVTALPAILFCSRNETLNEVGTQTFIDVNQNQKHQKVIIIPETSSSKEQNISKEAPVNTDSHTVIGFIGFENVISDEIMKQLGGISLSFFAVLLQFIIAGKDGQPAFFKKISRENRLLLFLMKMKLGLSFCSIGCFFGVTRHTASSVFYNVLETLLVNTKTWIFWPSRDAIKETMPSAFHNYPNCRAIIDCTEVRCDSPPEVEQRVFMYSSYKEGFTIKFLVAISPSGLITFLSKCYGGKWSDGYITHDSGFIKLVDPGDEMFADKEFPLIESELRRRQCTLVMPPYNPQFTRDEFLKGYSSIASVRTRVKRAIRRIKTFRILKYIPHDLYPHVDKIVRMVCILVNNKEPLIKEKVSANTKNQPEVNHQPITFTSSTT